VTAVLPREVIDEAFDLDAQLRNVDAIFDRVFGQGQRQRHLEPADLELRT
jgi:hypothetical protein